jgi:hypothetical protein
MTETTEDPKKVKSIYQSKAKQSFKSRFNLLLYSRIREGNISKITLPELEGFTIEDNEVVLKEYLHVYWQLDDKAIREEYKDKSVNDIYLEMKQWREDNKPIIIDLEKHYIKNIFPNEVFKKEEFNAFYQGDIECEYCHLDEGKIKELIKGGQINKKHHSRGWSLEIDRKKPNHEYTKDNVVWCCYWCNNAKTDEFSHEEFKIIGKTLKQIWDARLSR